MLFRWIIPLIALGTQICAFVVLLRGGRLNGAKGTVLKFLHTWPIVFYCLMLVFLNSAVQDANLILYAGILVMTFLCAWIETQKQTRIESGVLKTVRLTAICLLCILFFLIKTSEQMTQLAEGVKPLPVFVLAMALVIWDLCKSEKI